jgi:hypothetical protein
LSFSDEKRIGHVSCSCEVSGARLRLTIVKD